MPHSDLYARLTALSETQLKEAVYLFGLPDKYLPKNATAVDTAISLIRYAEQQDGGIEKLTALAARLAQPQTPAQKIYPPRFILVSVLLLLAISAGLMWWRYQPDPELSRQIRQAEQLAETGEYAAAEAELRKLQERAPDHARIRQDLEKLETMQALFAGASFNAGLAEQQLNALLQRFPEDSWVLALQGHIQVRTAQWDKAAESYRRALAQNPAMPDAHFGLGNVYLWRHDYAQAQAEFEQALQAAPQRVKYLSNLAFALRQQGQWEAAAKHYIHAIRLEPDAMPLYLDLAETYWQQGEREQAKAWLAKLEDLMNKAELRELPKNRDEWWLGGEVSLRDWQAKQQHVRRRLTEAGG